MINFSESLRNSGLSDGDTVLVHSDMTTIRKNLGITNWLESLIVLHNALQTIVGDSGTILAPAFNYGFCSGKSYDHDNTPSEVGMYGDYLRRQGVRSLHPIYSFAAQGPRAHDLCDNVSHSSFGRGSVFERLVECDAKILFVGCSFQRCTLVHHAEQMANVPYRFSKYFTGQITVNGQTYTDTYEQFCRYLDEGIESDFSLLEMELERKGQLRRFQYGILTSANAVYETALEILSRLRHGLLQPQNPRVQSSVITDVRAYRTKGESIPMIDLVRKIYPLNRTLVCDGHDEALRVIGEHLPAMDYQIEAYASTRSVWTWRVPERYVVHEAYLEDEDGQRIADYAINPLHLVSYSPSVDKWLTWGELQGHLYTEPKRYWAIPWRFKFYERDWGFCISQEMYDQMSDQYERDRLAESIRQVESVADQRGMY